MVAARGVKIALGCNVAFKDPSIAPALSLHTFRDCPSRAIDRPGASPNENAGGIPPFVFRTIPESTSRLYAFSKRRRCTGCASMAEWTAFNLAYFLNECSYLTMLAALIAS